MIPVRIFVVLVVALLLPSAAFAQTIVVHISSGTAAVAPPYAAIRDAAHAKLGPGRFCNEYADELHVMLTARGIASRVVTVRISEMNDYDTHTFDEVRFNGRWVIQDPTFEGWWSIDGRAASAADLQAALAAGHLEDVIFHGPADAMTSYYVNPLLLFREVQYHDGSPTTIVNLPDLYYTTTDPENSTAQVMVVHGGDSWSVGTYRFALDAAGEWVSPIAVLAGAVPTGNGHGSVELRYVPRFPRGQVIAP